MDGINVLAVLVAAATAFLLGGLWYSPVLFLKPWNRAAGRGDVTHEEKGGHPAKVFGLSYLFAAISAFAFAWILGPNPELSTAVCKGLVVGFGFVAASFGINYQFANRPTALWLIDGGYHVVQFVVYGVVLGLWH